MARRHNKEWEPQVSYDSPEDRSHWRVTLYWADGSDICQYVTVPDDDRNSLPPTEIVIWAVDAHGISEEHLTKFTQEWVD